MAIRRLQDCRVDIYSVFSAGLRGRRVGGGRGGGDGAERLTGEEDEREAWCWDGY
jgi:hypothetical protein